MIVSCLWGFRSVHQGTRTHGEEYRSIVALVWYEPVVDLSDGFSDPEVWRGMIT